MGRVHLVANSSEQAGRLDARGLRSAGAEARPQHVRSSILGEQCALKVGVRLDEQPGPVALELEEQRVGERLAVGGAALDEEAVSTSRQKAVDKRRLAGLRHVRDLLRCLAVRPD